MSTRKPAAPLAAALVLLAGVAHAAIVTSVFNGRVPCVFSPGVGQACSSAGVVNRVESWDGVPLDATVLSPPPEQNGPFPLIVDLHGFGQGKSPSELSQLVPQGYIVLFYSARGQHFSCGSVASRQLDPTLSNPNACTERGWSRLADARYEVRDTQYLSGLLVDQGLALPDIGVTGISFGGGQSLTLAALKNRMMLPDGSLVPWLSPGGVPMSIAAAAPLIGWSDLASALVPNGRTLDYRALNPYGPRGGVMKKSYVDVLYDVGVPTAFYPPPGADPDADIDAWKTRLDQGEPYDDDPLLQHAITEITSHHSGYYIDDSIPPAPLFIYNAITDDIMPAVQSLRFYNKTKSLYPGAEISLQLLDGLAHPRGNLGSPMRSITYDRVQQHLRRHLEGVGAPLPGVEVYTQACNGSAQAGPFTAADWASLRPGEVRYVDATPKVFDSDGGDVANAAVDDPAGATFATACRTVPTSTDDPGAATYRVPAAACTYTLMGSPTVIADLNVVGDYAEIAARLWDVAPDTTQSLVTHGLYRPRLDNLGPQVFQLEPNGWQFAAGHVAKLELLGQSAPYGRASNGTFTITASNLELRLPTLEAPGTCGAQTPAAPVLPPTAPEGTTTTSTTVIGTTTTSTTMVPPSAETVLGKRFLVKDPASAAQRKVVGIGKERSTDNVILGNPVANGAALEIIANGGTSSAQNFSLPKEGWRASSIGYRYSGSTGAIRSVMIRRTPANVFIVKVVASGRRGAVDVVPPNPGNDGGFVLTLNGIYRYCVAFGGAAGGTETADTAGAWSMRNATGQGCPAPAP
jgi:predicted acyl esterase